MHIEEEEDCNGESGESQDCRVFPLLHRRLHITVAAVLKGVQLLSLSQSQSLQPGRIKRVTHSKSYYSD